ncbi:MAG: tyrosine-type recombinase/integrase [Parasporobacterium sp.]|nr:tyrosine-type recombinase/integrase [Parasporobacterium sp.]
MPKKKFYGFQSGFADDLNDFIQYKRSLGYAEVSYFNLNSFDAFCAERDPDAKELTQDIVLDWCGMSEKGTINRCSVIREFAKYLISVGKPAFIYPALAIPPRNDGLPYIIPANEQEHFFDATDSLPHSNKSPIMEYTAPVVFRIMLGCGLRPREAVDLERRHFDFAHNTIYIEDSKNHRDRRIAISQELADLCTRYDCIAEGMFPGRTGFFPNRFGKPMSYPSLVYLFQKSWDLSGNDIGNERPSLYSFRFTFATETLMRWVEEERDIDAMIPYLSAYMGHVKFKDTYYYIKLLPDRIRKMKFMNIDGILPEVDRNDWWK